MRHLNRQHHRLLGEVGWERTQGNSKFTITGIPFCRFLKCNSGGILSYHHQINIFSEKRVAQIRGDADKSGEVGGPFLLLDPGDFQEPNIVDHLEDIEHNAFSRSLNASYYTHLHIFIKTKFPPKLPALTKQGMTSLMLRLHLPLLIPLYLFQCRRRQLVERITQDLTLAVSIANAVAQHDATARPPHPTTDQSDLP